MAAAPSANPRTALICGPYLSGKTSLLEALLVEAGALGRHASPGNPFGLGDSSPEARAHEMSTEMNVATTEYLGDSWTFIDCPGSNELLHETRCAMSVADVAVVVVEPDEAKAITLAAQLRALDELGVPHIVFINKMDKKEVSVKALMEAFQSASDKPMILREIPIRDGDTITGHVDLVSERAFHWQENKPSSMISLPQQVADRESEARTELFENLADFDDTLLEKLLEDVVPSNQEIYENLSRDLSGNLVVPVFFGSATNGNGVRRLMKALRHDAPGVAATAERMGIDPSGETRVRIFKTLHAGHAGKMSLGRVMSGTMSSGDTLNKARPASLNRLFGAKMEITQNVVAGDIVGFTKLDESETGDVLTHDDKAADDGVCAPQAPLFGLAIKTANRGDDVKLPENLRKIMEEDPSLSTDFDESTGEQIFQGQGEMHLKLGLERLKNRSGLVVNSTPPKVAYRETIRKKVEKRVRHRKQSGGHGEFGEVHLRVAPRPRGGGFAFNDEIHGGVVPKQYIPAVEAGVTDCMSNGPLGFPVVDVEVTLFDGKFHAVDSSEMAFRKAGGQAMRDGLGDARPVLLEPMNKVSVFVPNQFIARIQKIVLGRRGQIFGFEAKEGWLGWDEVTCQIPAAEMQGLIIEIRSATMGVGSFEATFDHLQEVSGEDVAKVLAEVAEATA